jgi:large subunit ribosomal protein L23
MKNAHDVVKGMLRTEKGTAVLQPRNKYLFWVDSSANKVEIGRAVEEIYKVKVKAVNTIMARGKLRRVRYQIGKTPDWKKAVVTLGEGSKIEVV